MLLGNRRAGELGCADGCIDAVLDERAARWAPLWSDDPLPPDLADWLGGFDRIVAYLSPHDKALAERLRTWGERCVTGSARITTAPAARHLLEPLRAWGLGDDADLAPVLRLAEPAQAEAARRLATLPADFVAVHPGSGSPTKTWPLDRWHALSRCLDAPLLWITGEAEAHLAPPGGPPALRAHDWPLPVLAAALARCRYFLGHDTGITHLAAAAGARGWALFGPTDPAVWAPPTPRIRVVRAPDGRLTRLDVDEVARVVLGS